MNTSNYYWTISAYCEENDSRYVYPTGWSGARGSARSNIDHLMRSLTFTYTEADYLHRKREKAPKLPDNYPKGDLDKLLGVGDDC